MQTVEELFGLRTRFNTVYYGVINRLVNWVRLSWFEFSLKDRDFFLSSGGHGHS